MNMKIRGTKQVLHWLFLAVGIISVLVMAFSVVTYLDYAGDGYGLKVSVAEAWLGEDALFIRLRVENPGGLEIHLGGTGNDNNLTVGSTYQFALEDVRIKADNTTSVIIEVGMNRTDMDNLRIAGMADMVLNLRLYVPERDLATNLRLEAEGVEVRA